MGQSFSNPFLTLGGYFVVGMSYTSLGHYQSALNHLRHALDLSQTAGDRFWRARLLNTVGWVYRELFDLEQDPGEFRNLWNEPGAQAVKRDLLARMPKDSSPSSCSTAGTR